ncbi:MAG: aminotransferase class IV [Chloroflexi bacterium]|nr:aminotransferase class IV [Chloroflexota bacterium]
MAGYQAYFNGKWMPEGEVTISPSDRGFTVGDLVFEVERTFNGKPFRLKEHIERLCRSLTYVRMESGLSAEEMTAITEEAVERAKAVHPEVTDFWMRQIVTRGTVDLFDPPAPTVLLQVGEQGFWYADLYDTGMHGVISKTRAYSPQALDPKIKHYSRMNFVLAHQEAHDVEPGAWPILLDDRGFLAEGNGQNIFLVTDGVIRTPTDYAALQGVSRGMAIDLTHQLGIPLVEEDLQPYDLYTADEAFWTTTSMCVMPLTQVDRRPIGDGKPGPMSKRLLAAWSEAVGIDIVGQAQQYENEIAS